MLEQPKEHVPSERERDVGLAALRLVLTWQRWVHRRVESISLEDPVTVLRQVSVDFTIARDQPTPIRDGAGNPIHFVPVTLLAKRPLTRFSIRDETGAALPLLTRQRNGSLAFAMLYMLGERTVPPEVRREHGDIPVDVAGDIWTIATSDSPEAVAACDSLADPQGPSTGSRAWRRALATSTTFMSLARDLAENFLVTVPLMGPPGNRRIIKFSYEEHIDDPKVRLVRPARWLGRRIFRILAGQPLTTRAPRREVDFKTWLLRGAAFRPKAVVVDVPAIAHGGSYHLEIEAPEGLLVTRGILSPYWGARPLAPERTHTVKRSLQRMHLYAGSLPIGTRGQVLVNLRPAPSTIIRAATVVGLFTTVVLGLVATRWTELVANLGAIPSLLLIVPAGLAAYVARAREPSVTTSVLLGLRLLALLSGLWAYAAALILVAGRSCSEGAAGVQECASWAATPILMWTLVVLSSASTAAIGGAWVLTSRPPEQQ